MLKRYLATGRHADESANTRFLEKTASCTWSITRKRDVFHLKKSSKIDVETLFHSNINYCRRFSNMRVVMAELY